jgi:hypothetical protein
MAYDSDRGVTVLFGGKEAGTFPTDNETWEYDGSVWKTIPIIGSKPNPRTGHAMAYDVERHQVVLFGGSVPSNRETWTYTSDGVTGTWTRRFPSDPPGDSFQNRCDGGIYGHAMVYDSARRVVLLQGGAMWCDSIEEFQPDYNRVFTRTWQWDGSNWAQVGGNPGDRLGAAMAFDPVLGVSVLFGGTGCTSPGCYDYALRTGTWLHSQGTWTEATGATPGLRFGHTMAYDSQRNKIVMFGGGGTGLSDDTDEYTGGVGWTSLLDTGPPPRQSHAMVYDSRRGVMVVYGGQPPSGQGAYDDTWELDVCTRPPEVVRWIDFAYTGQQESGTFTAPFNTLAEGVTSIPAGGTLKIKAGRSAETLTISKPMTISAYSGPAVIGR